MSTQEFGLALRTEVRARVASEYADEGEELIERRAEMLLPFVSKGVAGDLRFDTGAALIAPRVVVPLTPGDSETSKLMRSIEIMQRRAPPPRSPNAVRTDAKTAIRALGKLSPTASEETKLRRAADIVAILRAAGHTEEDPNANDD